MTCYFPALPSFFHLHNHKKAICKITDAYLLHINGFQTLLDHVKSPPTHHLCLNHYHQLPPPFHHITNTKNVTCHNQPHNRVCPLFSSLFILLMSFPIYPALAQKTCHTGVFLCSTTCKGNCGRAGCGAERGTSRGSKGD